MTERVSCTIVVLASVNGQVVAFDDMLADVTLAEVLEVHIELATDDKTAKSR
jgi:hypothetical protein